LIPSLRNGIPYHRANFARRALSRCQVQQLMLLRCFVVQIEICLGARFGIDKWAVDLREQTGQTSSSNNSFQPNFNPPQQMKNIYLLGMLITVNRHLLLGLAGLPAEVVRPSCKGIRVVNTRTAYTDSKPTQCYLLLSCPSPSWARSPVGSGHTDVVVSLSGVGVLPSVKSPSEAARI